MVDRNSNLNFLEHDRIVAYPKPLDVLNRNTGILVYPDARTNHAVIQQMQETPA